MTVRNRILAAAGILLLAGIILLNAIPREVTLSVNGQAQTLRTRGWTVKAALAEAGIVVNENDRLDPAASTLLLGKPSITLEKAVEISIRIFPSGDQHLVTSTERTPSGWLESAELALAGADRLTIHGIGIDPESTLPYAPHYHLDLQVFQVKLMVEVVEVELEMEMLIEPPLQVQQA